MSDLAIRTLDGGTFDASPDALSPLTGTPGCELHPPGSAVYEEARTLWNGMIDRRPALVARCASADAVAAAVAFAGRHDLLLSVRGAGHNIAGSALCEGGLTLDLSRMRSVVVDPATRHVRVQPGATLGDIDAATAPHGLVVPTGINSTTGIAGLTLGGGFGWLTRKFGLTVDSLVSARVVTANGKQVTANAQEHSDLFWALRGGGGNFGVVTEFTFEAHALGPDLLSGLIVHPFEQARAVFDVYRDLIAGAPDELTVFVVLRKAPPLPFLPEAVHGREVVVFAFAWAGDPAEGEQAIAPLAGYGKPHGVHFGVQPFAAWQQAFDPLLAPGARNYWKSHNFAELADGLLDTMIGAAGALPTDETEIFVAQLGGAPARIADDATAYPHRQASNLMNIHARWQDADDDARVVAWARDLFAAAAPFATGGVYSNFMPDDEADRVAAGAYGANYDRLTRIKKAYDPANRFRSNQNVRPAS